jgi:hypothetical protein
VLSLLATLLMPAPVVRPIPAAPADGEALVRAMHDKYKDKWYRTLSFVQTTTDYRKNTKETWYEAARIPGILRIDIAPLDSGKTILFRNDTIYQFDGGALKASQPFVHPLMVLGFDVYLDPVERTLERLKGIGFDLSKIREDKWQGRDVYVVGAAAGDTASKQFWVDKERLVFVRSIEPARNGSGNLVETQFNKYQPLGKGWISVEVKFSVAGKLVTMEEYADVKGDPALPDVLFDPAKYGPPAWVTTPVRRDQ